MRLYILRHGKAAKRGDWDGNDADRPLTRKGVEHAGRITAALKPRIEAREILTSPWTRARQTAEIASGAWCLPLREVSWLAGGALPAEGVAAELPKRSDVVLVGHEPDLGALVRLLCGARIDLKKCGLAILEGDPEADGMTLRALLPPRFIGDDDG